LQKLADALHADRAPHMDMAKEYAEAGYVRTERNGKRVWTYPPGDLREERQAVYAAWKEWDTRRRERLEAEATLPNDAEERELQSMGAKRVTLAEFGARRGEVIAVSDDRTTLTLYCPKTDEILQVDTGGKPLPEVLQPGHFVDASRNYLAGGLNIKAAPIPKDYQHRVQIQGELPRLDIGMKR
jgi:hypothetical protein